jgi:hypothetical protein
MSLTAESSEIVLKVALIILIAFVGFKLLSMYRELRKDNKEMVEE